MRHTLGRSCALILFLCVGWQCNRATAIDLLHEFARAPIDGTFPRQLILNSSTLFGVTSVGGVNDHGTVFSLNTDGTGYTLLHEFADGAEDGSQPLAQLTLDGSTLFGTTATGGDRGFGTVFSMEIDGTDFQLLHEFAGNPSDGAHPDAGLTLSGSTLFGTTIRGGARQGGTVFSVNTDGSDFRILHRFESVMPAIGGPRAGLALDGSTLFGATIDGGEHVGGTVFSINTDGTGFEVLHEFAGGVDDGRRPSSDLTLSSSKIFGTTLNGGNDDQGTVFSLDTDGTGFNLLHEFAGGVDDGARPFDGVVLSGSTLFGTTGGGGDEQAGTVFSLEVPEPGSLSLVTIGSVFLFPTIVRIRVGKRINRHIRLS